jgi:polygalacturonase
MKLKAPLISILSLMILSFLILSGSGCLQTPAMQEESCRVKVKRPVFPDRDFTVTDFGATGNGITLCTESINQAILACSREGGGRVVIPAGIWLTGPLQLQSNVNLHAEEGALVFFSGDLDQYPFIKTYFEGKEDFRAMPLLYGNGLENIAITGKGVFNGSGEAWRPVKSMKMTRSQWSELVNSGGVVDAAGSTWWPNQATYDASRDPERYRSKDMPDEEREKAKAYFRPPLLQLINCKTILLDGPVFENSPGWCIHPVMCEDLTVHGITVKNPWYAQNGDGIDVESSVNVIIDGSNFDVGDDAVCLKSGKDEEGRKRGMPTRNVEVRNCVVHHGHGGFVVGSEMSGGVRDVWVSGCTFIGTDIGLRFKSNRGRGGVVENIHIEDIRMVNIATDGIIFNLFYQGLGPTEESGDHSPGSAVQVPPVTEGTPEFRNITMSNIFCNGAERAVNIIGLPEMPVRNIRIENSTFKAAEGICCFYAKALELENVRVLTRDTPTLVMVNVDGLVADSVQGNDKTLLALHGAGTRDILVRTDDREKAIGMILAGEDVSPGTFEVEVIE